MTAAPYLIGAGIGADLLGAGRRSRAMRREADRRVNLAETNAQRRAVAGQQAAFEEERQARLAQSRALALSAASGASPGRGSDARIIADIGAEGAYRAALQVYEAGEDARMIRLGARNERRALNREAKALRIGAAADAVISAGSLYSRYGNGGPGVDTGGED